MKFPYLIRATLMPASRAPSRLPPTATVCSPHRVRVSTMWKMTTSTTAQMNADHPQALVVSLPKNFPMCSAEAGMLTGSPWEVVSTRPYSTNDVPSVAMNDGSRSVTTRNPLTAAHDQAEDQRDDDGQDYRARRSRR